MQDKASGGLGGTHALIAIGDDGVAVSIGDRTCGGRDGDCGRVSREDTFKATLFVFGVAGLTGDSGRLMGEEGREDDIGRRVGDAGRLAATADVVGAAEAKMERDRLLGEMLADGSKAPAAGGRVADLTGSVRILLTKVGREG